MPTAQTPPADLKRLTLEELMRIDVTTATRQPEPVGSAPAAVSVLTAEDLRRAGVVTIADALRLVPGLHVARVNNGVWAISSRGFNAPSATKLLVMVDGRNAFSPLFTGVFWNMLDYPLEDIERIEVFRGPGGALWGANAVNGVVNIVTRSSLDTRGNLVSLGTGIETPATVTLRHGGVRGTTGFRVWGTYDQRDAQQLADGTSADDRRQRGMAGFRVDGSRGAHAWWLTGSLFHSDQHFSHLADGTFGEGVLQAHWSRPAGSSARLDVQTFYRRESRDVPDQLRHTLNTVDVDVQHGGTFGRHTAVWGGGYRHNWDDTFGGSIAFDPPSRTYPVVNLFAQDEYALVPSRLFLTAGVKVEHNDFSGAEWQPTVRVRYLPGQRQTVWSALSRAIRRPARLDTDVRSFAPNGALVAVGGGSEFRGEELVGFDAGYRVEVTRWLTAETVTFHYAYDDLRSVDATGVPSPALRLANSMQGSTHGVTLSMIAQPLRIWRTQINYTHQRVTVESAPGTVTVGTTDINDPRHLLLLRQQFDFGRGIEADLWLRRIGTLPQPHVPAYSELDARIGWRRGPLDVALVGNDLLHSGHVEFGEVSSQPVRVFLERDVRVTTTVRF